MEQSNLIMLRFLFVRVQLKLNFFTNILLLADDGSGNNANAGSGSVLDDILAEKLDRSRENREEQNLSDKILVMQPILRFLQLLCENHNRHLQVVSFIMIPLLVCSFKLYCYYR